MGRLRPILNKAPHSVRGFLLSAVWLFHDRESWLTMLAVAAWVVLPTDDGAAQPGCQQAKSPP